MWQNGYQIVKKIEMLIFALLMINPSNESHLKCKEMAFKLSKKWNVHFYITFNFWWSAEQSEGQKSPKMWKNGNQIIKNMKCSFGLHSTSNHLPAIRVTKVARNAKLATILSKMKCSFCIMFNFWWSAKQFAQNVTKWQKFLWQNWLDQKLTPQEIKKLEIWPKKIYGRFGMTKIWCTAHPQKDVDGTRTEHKHEQARDGTCTHDGLGGFYPDGILHCWQLCHKPFGFLVVHNSLWHITNSFVFFLTENSRVSGCLLVQPCLTTGTCECWSIDLSLKIDRN